MRLALSHWLCFLVGISVWLSACATKPVSSTPPVVGAPSSSLPPVAGQVSAPITSSTSTPQKVGVILGPGSAKAMAHVGVLKQLVEARIPIHAVVGVEWGSLIGALYAQRAQVHELDWMIYKLEQKDEDLKAPQKDKKAQTIQLLDSFFKENLSQFDISQSTLPFACPSVSLWTGTLVWQEKGNMAEAIKRCLPSSPMFRPSHPWMAANFSLDAAFEYLRKHNVDFIIVVNVLDKGDLFKSNQLLDFYESATLWNEARRVWRGSKRERVEWIQVPTSGYYLWEFQKRRELITLGEKSAQTWLKKVASEYGL